MLNGKTLLRVNLPEAKGDARDLAAKQTGVSRRSRYSPSDQRAGNPQEPHANAQALCRQLV